MILDTDVKERSVSFDVPKKIYSMDALRIAAQILAPKIDVYLDESKTDYEVTLKAKRRDAGEAQLAALAGEFGNELLNQEYRFVVGRFNAKISSLIITQTLMAARGGEAPAAPPAEESTPAFKKLVAELVKNAEAEVARTMPKKISDQGNPLPPVKEDAGV
jgi:His-Xaa-Ser system protein HxsD